MAKTGGKPGSESLSSLFDEFKNDGAAWLAAEQALLQARVQSGARRIELAAIMIIGALMVTVAGTITLANVLVELMAPSLGPVTAGLIVGLALLLAGALLIIWVKSLLRPTAMTGRTQASAKLIWSALNEPN